MQQALTKNIMKKSGLLNGRSLRHRTRSLPSHRVYGDAGSDSYEALISSGWTKTGIEKLTSLHAK
jgi:hypothetical protein